MEPLNWISFLTLVTIQAVVLYLVVLNSKKTKSLLLRMESTDGINNLDAIYIMDTIKSYFINHENGLAILNQNQEIVKANKALIQASPSVSILDEGMHIKHFLNSVSELEKMKNFIERTKKNNETKDFFIKNNLGEYYPARITIKGFNRTGKKFFILEVQDQSSMKEQTSNLIRLAKEDQLTGLPNRLGFFDRAKLSIKSHTQGRKFGVGFLDVDKFKSINDTYGHNVGDEFLIEIAKRLKESVRDTDIVARLAGDEFTILANNIRGEDSLTRISEKIKNDVSGPFKNSEGLELEINCSVGFSIYPDDIINQNSETDAEQVIEDLLKIADRKMYEIKKNKNQ